MDYSDYETHELYTLQDLLIEEIQELHNMIEEKSEMLNSVVGELNIREDENWEDYLNYISNDEFLPEVPDEEYILCEEITDFDE